MGSGTFALMLIVGIVLFVTGGGGTITWGLIAIGGLGLLVSAFSGK